ncbi:metallophosphoesterase [Haloplasma contractile]|nr:metallophosphoesterase [Haloplasma contractile]
MKYFSVSDIHGCYKELREALSEAGFDPNNKNHKLIVCGDLFDRGDEHVNVYYYLKELVNKDRAIVIKGNHELFFKDLIYGEERSHRSINFNIKHNGFGKTLSDFTGIPEAELTQYSITELATAFNKRHPGFLNWIHELQFYYETESYVFTHAGIDIDTDDWKTGNWEKQVWQDLRIYQHFNLHDVGFDKKLVMGHYPTHHFDANNEIYKHPDHQKIFIDGGCVYFEESTINVLILDDCEMDTR